MKLSKQQEKEILRVHEAYWDSYLKGDVPSMTALLDEHYTQVGSAEGEVFANKKDAVQFLLDTIDQVAGKLEMRNRVTKLEVESKTGRVFSQSDPSGEDTPCLVHERADIFVLADGEWIFYSKFRASTLLQKRGKEWKIIHQHSSFPDTRAEEGQNIATEKIAAENLQLREAVKRRTTELEQKSRELEIEASLERVRAMALSMRKPDDLPGICEVLFTELSALGFSEIRNAMINIHDDEKGTFINYDYSDEIGRSINHLTYTIHPLIEKQIKQIRSAGDAFSETSFTGKDLKEWKKFRKKIGEKDDPRIKNIDALHYYFYSIGTGSIGISTFSAITDEKRNVLKRFRNVFDFAYRRYMDVAQAEAQAKEAQIEVALERVRARAMAMHSSSELIDVANVLRDQMGLLGQHQIETMAIHLYKDDEELFDSWYAGRDQSGKLVSGTTRFKKDSCWLLREVLAGYNSVQQEYDIEASGENLQEWLRVLVAAAPEYENILKDFPEKSYYHITDFSGGSMIMVAYQPPTDETKALQKKCANVFDLAYRRFMDIKQAEAQTREVQIELALERVRARTMAMHDSSELSETAQVLFQQFADMGGIPDRISICIVDETNEVVNFWTTDQSGSQITKSFQGRLNESTTLSKAYSAWKKQDKFLLVDLTGRELKEWIHFVREEMGLVVKDDFFKDRRVHHIALFSHGWIMISAHEPQSLETINILERFASVFNLTFRRFLDLQKAEAQAKEAQIELALERVRARTMAMHKSEEVMAAAVTVYDELQKLDFKFGAATIIIMDKETGYMEHWLAGFIQKNHVESYRVNNIDHPLHVDQLKAWRKGDKFVSIELSGKSLKAYAEEMFIHSGYKNLPDEEKALLLANEHAVFNMAYMKQGALMWAPSALSDEKAFILQRFAQVFEQTYTRFLDLQKAEAQAREAEIQLALERVRARSLAMHHTSELQDIVDIVAQQLYHIGMDINGGVVITINDEVDEDLPLWASSGAADYVQKVVVPFFDRPIFTDLRNAIIRRNNFFTNEYSNEEKDEMFDHLFRYAPWSSSPEERKKELLSREGGLTRSATVSQYTSIAITNHNGKKFSEEEHEILKRFGNVFEQSYTRFLDLQKAEAQARESQIEIALEKVRSNSLAMHNSNELEQVVGSLFDRLVELGLSFDGAFIFIFEKEKRNIRLWIATYHLSAPVIIDLPYDKEIENNAIIKDLWNALENGEQIFNRSYSGKTKNDYFRYVQKYNESKIPESVRNFQIESESWTAYLAAEKNSIVGFDRWSGHNISKGDFQILIRFSKVFEQAYTRFLDLQKAEAQARESQIQLALERVRARTMAMHKSDELPEISFLLFQQVQELGETAVQNSIGIINEETGFVELSTTIHGSHVLHTLKVPMDDPHVMAKGVAAWKAKRKSLTLKFEGQELKDYNKLRNSFLKTKVIFPEDQWIVNLSFFSKGWLSFSFNKNVSGEIVAVQKRFASVFEQTYTRFLDLQKAEAQTREAKIEAALERTRTQSMIMQHSKELDDTLRVFHEQVLLLGIRSAFSFLWLPDEDKDRHIFWAAWAENNSIDPLVKNGSAVFKSKAINYPMDRNEPATAQCLVDWKGKEPVVSYHVPPVGVESYFAAWQELIEGVEQLKPEYFSDGLYYVEAFMKYGCFGVMVATDLPEEEKKILGRVAIEFERTYTRFLDLQKAEAQAREAKIEAALEKVRSRTMAMQQSAELAEVATVLFQQVKALGVAQWAFGFSIFEIDDKECTWYSGTAVGEILPSVKIPLTEHPVFISFNESRKRGDEFFVYEKEGEYQAGHYRYMMSLPGMHELLQGMLDAGMSFPTFQIDHLANFSHGNLVFITFEPVPEMHDVFKRFAKVFDQTYTRFLDLQQAEAQAREAQIELGLERVRARAMAMQKSDELKELIGTVHTELTRLDLILVRCFIMIYDIKSMGVTWWMSNPEIPLEPFGLFVKYHEQSPYLAFIDAWKERKLKWQYTLEGTIKKNWDSFLFVETELSRLPDFVIDNMKANEKVYLSASFNNFGCLTLATLETLSDEHFDILLRFAKVFDLTYTRFNDLKQAEAQARESQIQLALERVRARTMAMQRSDELMETAVVLFDQLNQLGENIERTIIGVMNEEERVVDVWATRSDGSQMVNMQNFPIDEPIVMQKVYTAWQQQKKSIVIDLRGEELERYFQFLKGRSPRLKQESFDERRVENFAFFSKGMLGIINADPNTPANVELYERFAAVFEQTYTRFLDLQKAEAQARESQIELGLERVRARAMAMQKSVELSELVDTVFKELTKLDFALTWCIINIIDEPTLSNTVWAANPDIDKLPESYHMLFEDYPFHHAMMKGWKERKTKQVYTLEGSEKKVYDEYLFNETEFRKVPEAAQAASRAMEKYVVSFSFSNFGGLQTVGDVSLSDANLDILSRFGKVFDLTYTRFNDLQKAEAQAREAQIQLALERVRARTMAMQHSDELKVAAALLFQQVKSLGAPAYSCGYNIWEKNEKEFTSWMSTQDGSIINGVPNIPLTEDANFIRYVESKEKGEQFFVLELMGKRMQEHYEYLKTIPAFKAYFDYAISVGFDLPETQIHHLANFSNGNLLFITLEPCPEFHDVFKRFAAVFEQTYTRFLDLEKAEAQVREAQIETALERVRSRSIGMQKSIELGEVVHLLDSEIGGLGIRVDSTSIITDFSEIENGLNNWLASRSKKYLEKFHIPFNDSHPVSRKFIDARSKGLEYYSEKYNKLEKDEYFRWLFKYSDFKNASEERQKSVYDAPGWTRAVVVSKNSLLIFQRFRVEDFTEEESGIFKRFGRVFEQSYTRFLDLQKAEAQAREAQIEAALERVRAKTMSMQRSDELAEVATVLFQQVKALGVPQWTCGFSIFEIDDKEFIWYPGSADGDILPPVKIPLTEHPVFISFNESRKRGDEFFVYEKEGEYQAGHYRYMQSLPGVGEMLQRMLDAGLTFPTFQIDHLANFSHGNLVFITFEPVPEMHDVFKRFGKVFEQTYTRFLDLQKAEAQAREAQIETALERVRSRSMGMQKSEELKDVIQVVYDQFIHLNIKIEHTGFVIDYKTRDDYNIWIADPLGVPSQIIIPYFDCIYYNRFNEAKEKGEDFFATKLSFEEKNEFYQKLFEYVPGLPEEAKKFYFSCPGLAASTVLLENVCLYIENFSAIPYTDEENNTLMRFGKVFQQTYTRFLDLQKVEVQAQEAIKRASVDRVRAEIASMRTTHDLERIIPLIWTELTTLGVPFIRCGVFIVDEVQKQIQTLLSTPEGKAIASFQLPFENTEPLPELLPHWQRKEIYKQHWDEAAFIASTKILMQRGAITESNQEQYTTAHRPTNLHLHFLPFLQGMLYVGSDVPLSDDEVQLAQNLADAFSTAYARYEDFNKLEAANNKIEKTLVDLKQTQSQLVQSEKMASLGELTAGIAHEIQNPLNFVNNFSEVNTELIDEMKDELAIGNTQLAIGIAEDIKQNLEKINHHGKRAESIVKGMLQHSRKSTGIKEPTDINALADEYMRLSYHGLRAKDKSFNADFKMDLDPTLPLVKVIPQDIGRVLLNLFNNAFWACAERGKLEVPSNSGGNRKSENANFDLPSPISDLPFSPLVTLTTKNLGDHIEIRIHDNGPGIPSNIIDKIFQPFFTTKPTGQGTGLGLSLAYDIIKAHQGELKVETREGEGVEFIIQLPTT